MIARTWKGRVPASKATEYYEFLLRTGVSDYQATPGNRGVLMQRRIERNEAHFVLTTLWDSIDSVKAFAGEEYERARYYPEDDDYLIERDTYVTHAEVLVASGLVAAAPPVQQFNSSPLSHLPSKRDLALTG
jgi:heme-degrading monooxygenase HmoA